MPSQGEKWSPTGSFKERSPRFSWWAVGTLAGIVAVLITMAVIQSC